MFMASNPAKVKVEIGHFLKCDLKDIIVLVGAVLLGAGLAFVAMYNGNPQSGEWNNFGGYLVNTGTASRKAISRVLNSIQDDEWRRLKKAIRTLEQPFAKGLEWL